jgi:hypothetical protein
MGVEWLMSREFKKAWVESGESSNAIYLTGRQWIGVGLFALVLVLFAPSVWQRFERFNLEPDYRMPYGLSEDYWFYDRYARLATSHFDTVLLGDSVVWGQYVTREQTLSHYLNEQAGQERFANLGLNGAHPAALFGLIEHYAKGVSNKNVLVQCNPLWLSDPRHDLEGTEEFQFNHPRLVPQFSPEIPCYREQISPRIGIVVEQHVPFSAWTNHLQQAYFGGRDVPSWTLEHPYEDPLKPIAAGLPPSDNTLRQEPISWTKRGIEKQDFDWVALETSIQWHFFRAAVQVLQQRGNRVFVLLGPFNEHMLTERGLREYLKVKAGMEAWLREEGVAHAAPPPLPSELYADASHPLAEGYAMLAKDLRFAAALAPAGASTPTK